MFKPVGETALKILIIEDHPLVSKGLRGLIENSIANAEVDELNDAKETLRVVSEQRPELILLDLHMPDVDGFEVLSQLSENLSVPPIVVISSSADPIDMRRAFSLGAMGYIPKASSPEIMEKALSLVMSGGLYIPPEMLDEAGDEDDKSSFKQTRQGLTPRQIEVLELLSAGKANKEIAWQLECAETTVKTHVAAIFRELGARNRTEAVMQAQALGYLSADS